MGSIRRALGVLVLVASLSAPPAFAASFSADQSDLWYIPTETGWGMQLVQRNSTIFATLFVYDQATNPTWYVATMRNVGSFVWSGNLYATTGPWFGTAPFNPALVNAVLVGTMTWTAQSANTGNVSYTVNGVAVGKNVLRQTLVNENYAGHFGGGIHQVNTGCIDPALNTTIENIGVLNITQVGTNVAITAAANGGSCSYAGSLTQYGQMGDIVGAFVCTDGSAGSFHAFELQVTEVSIIGRFTASYVAALAVGCQATGWLGGLAVTTF